MFGIYLTMLKISDIMGLKLEVYYPNGGVIRWADIDYQKLISNIR